MKFFIEGNIGSGKSTLIEYLQTQSKYNEKKIKILKEPVDEWKNFKDRITGKNVLDYFYKDPERWGYLFQMNAFITRSKLIDKYKLTNTILMERSVYSDRYVFAKNCYEKGLITSIEWDTYINWFEWLSDMLELSGDAYIYLRTSPQKSYERIIKRNREEEAQISLEYISEIHEKHELWLNKKQDNILILDGDIENSQERLENFSTKILEFMETLLVKKQNIQSLKSIEEPKLNDGISYIIDGNMV